MRFNYNFLIQWRRVLDEMGNRRYAWYSSMTLQERYKVRDYY